MTATPMTEDQAVHLVRNALLVAGHEMGQTGDHWPVIKATVFDIMKDHEDLKIERNVDAEMKIHLYEQLAVMERGIAECPSETRDEVAKKLKELREVYDAYFSSVGEKFVALSSEELPPHLRRAKAITDTLEANDE